MSNDPNKPGGPAKTIMGWAPTHQAPPGAAPPGAPPAGPPPAQAPYQPPQAYVPPQAPYQPPPAPQPWQPPVAQAPYQPPQPQQPWQPPPAQAPYVPPQPYAAPQPQPYQPPPAQQPYQPPQPWQPPAQPQAFTPPSYAAGAHAAAQPLNSPPPAQPSLSRDATAGVSERVRFIRLTYLHLFGAILVFAGLEYCLMKVPFVVEKVSVPILRFSLGGQYNWAIVLALFMVVSWVADYWARHATSRAMQYAGLGLYVIAEAIIFLPLLVLAEMQAAEYLAKTGKEAHIIRDAAILTLAIFGALTASVFFSKKDFSFLRGGLAMASAAAMVLVFLSIFMGFNLGIIFSVAMVLLAAGYVLYYTSQVFAHYNPQQYVAAALALFSSVALMFWYVIRILMRLRQ